MLETDSFSHRGEDGSSSRDRIEDAGYELAGRWLTGENIAWVNEAGENGLSDEVVRLHTNLMNSPEHRANLLNPDFKEIGIGIETGDFVDDGENVDAVFVTQNFGTTSANSVLLPDDAAPAAVVDQTEMPTGSGEGLQPQTEASGGSAFDIAQFMADRVSPRLFRMIAKLPQVSHPPSKAPQAASMRRPPPARRTAHPQRWTAKETTVAAAQRR